MAYPSKHTGRTTINVVGNSIATTVVAKWEGQLGETVSEEAEDTPPIVEAIPAMA